MRSYNKLQPQKLTGNSVWTTKSLRYQPFLLNLNQKLKGRKYDNDDFLTPICVNAVTLVMTEIYLLDTLLKTGTPYRLHSSKFVNKVLLITLV